MNNAIQTAFGTWLVLAPGAAAAAQAESIRHEIEVFFSSGIGTVVSIILFFLLLLWLLLPLAVFGLKSRLREIARESSQANSALAELKETVKALGAANDTPMLLAEIKESNRLLAEIRDELAAIGDEAVQNVEQDRASGQDEPENPTEFYREIRFDP